jgi:SAM-dependent methyltransferase
VHVQQPGHDQVAVVDPPRSITTELPADLSAGAQAQVYTEVDDYEVAFSYRDIPREVDTLLAWFERHALLPAPPRAVLELAAGPAAHARELARRGAAATAVDRSPAMCARAVARACDQGVDLRVVCADMRAFGLDDRVDLAVMMLDSAAHLLDLDDLLANLRATAAHLRPGGLYVLEMSHPSDFLTAVPRTETSWEVTAPDRRVTIRWGGPDDPFDPVTQITLTCVTVETEHADGRRTLTRDVLQQRMWTATEVEAAARLSAGFEVVGRYGALEPDVPLWGDDGAWRMMTVLRRTP